MTTDDLRDAALAWPGRLDSWMAQFYADSPLYIGTYRLLGLSTSVDVVRLSLIVDLLSLAFLVWWMVASTGGLQRWRAGRLILLSPIAAILFATVGSYDGFTVLAWTVALWCWRSGSKWLLAIGGVLLGIQHFEQTLLGAAALTCTWLALRPDLPDRLRKVNPAWTVPGILVGKIMLVAIFTLSGESPTGRSGWIERFLAEWTKVAVVTLPYLVWSLFAGLWVLVALVYMRTSDRRARLLLLAAVGIGLLATAVSADRPRVFVVVILPSLAIAILAYLRSEGASAVELRAVELVAWLAPPIVLAGKLAVNVNIVDNAYVTFMWVTGLGGPT